LILGRHSAFLAGDEDLNLWSGRCIVAARSLVGEDAIEGVADQHLHLQDITVARCVRRREPASYFTWVTNWPPLAWLRVVATRP